MSDDGSELGVRELQPVDETAVHHDLAARHGVGVHVVGRKRVDLPFPAGCVGTECAGRGNQPLRNGTDAGCERRVRIELAGLARFLEFLGVGLRGTPLDVVLGDEHLLLALDADRTGGGGLHGLAA